MLFAADLSPEKIEFFESKIRPVLARECYECHNSRDKAKAGLILDHREAVLKGGDSGPAIVAGKPDQSLLVEALKHENDLEMPKAGVKLDPLIVADFEKWITLGAPDPRNDPPTDEELAKDKSWESIFKVRQDWWSFRPVQNPPVPDGEGSAIDRFIRAKLAEKNLNPSIPAEPRTLARRLHYALTGLPAAEDVLDQFEKDAAQKPAAATRALIDRLLASPQFGEKWARHWMDWIRYAESHGSEGDPKIENAHHFRDYLIRALNRDVPYNQLLLEQVAGDLLPNPRFDSETGFNESVLGTIHWRMVFHGFAPTDALDEKVRFTDDQINTFSKAFQSLTISCARCHNHKFDAISQADYYALFGILGSTRPGKKLINPAEELQRNKEALARLKPKIREAVARDWLASMDFLRNKLLDNKEWEKGKDPASIYHVFHLLNRDKNLLPADALLRVLKAAPDQSPNAAKMSMNLTQGDEHKSWFRYGNGVSDAPEKPGQFLISESGETVIRKILPSGIYSGLLSTKHSGRFTSPDFELKGKNSLYLLVNGDGQSMTRYVVQNYPRKGTVFKVTRLGASGNTPRKDWRWQPFDLEYWEGDAIHLEMSTARDSALLSGNSDRSWFGIREVRLIEKGEPAPPNPNRDFLRALPKSAHPGTVADIAKLYTEVAGKCIQSWSKGTASDYQALFLDKLIESGLLPQLN